MHFYPVLEWSLVLFVVTPFLIFALARPLSRFFGAVTDLQEEFIDEGRGHAEVHGVYSGGSAFDHALANLKRPFETFALKVVFGDNAA